MDKDRFIYALVDPRTDETRYIGVAWDVRKRFLEHLAKARSRPNQHRDRWIRSMLREDIEPTVVVLERIIGGEAWEWCERWWIARGRRLGWRLTNHTDGGEGVLGFIPSPATIELCRLKARQRSADPEYIGKLSAANQRRWAAATPEQVRSKMAKLNAGRTPETLQKIAASLKGKKMADDVRARFTTMIRKVSKTPEYRQKLSAAVRKVTQTEAYRRKMSESLKGRVFSEEHRRKLSEANRRRGERARAARGESS